MKKWVGMAVMVLAVAGVAAAGQLKGVAAWAEKSGAARVDAQLAAWGLTNALDRTALTSSWDEATLIETCVSKSAYNMIQVALHLGSVSMDGRARIKAAVLAQNPPPPWLVLIVRAYPVSERGDFSKVLDTVITAQYAAAPVFGKVFLKYTVLRGMPVYDPNIPEADTVPCLLAGEVSDIKVMQGLKDSIKERALRLARQKLRVEGKSFVVKDGVNPLAVMVQPVVDALNAPECAGLESALRAIGGDVVDQNRVPARTLVAQWQAEVFSGDMPTAQTVKVMGKIAVMLGPEAYNRFIDAYNNGTGTP